MPGSRFAVLGRAVWSFGRFVAPKAYERSQRKHRPGAAPADAGAGPVRTLVPLLARRVTPWFLVYDLVRQGHRQVTEDLTPAERRRIVELARGSRGNLGRLSADERVEARMLMKRLQLGKLASAAAKTTVGVRKHRRR